MKPGSRRAGRAVPRSRWNASQVCPSDALAVAPRWNLCPTAPFKDVELVIEVGQLGSYLRALAWGKGRTLLARNAIQPAMP